MIVKPEILVTPDYPIIRIREPRETVDLAAELPKVLTTQGWGIGTFFHVQFISHDRSTLLASAQFVVTQETEALLKRDIDNYQTMTKSVTTRKFAQMTEWWLSETPTERQLVWNPGRKMHQIKEGDTVVFESADKETAARFLNGESRAA
jgi:hypothetical protein